MAGVTNTKSAPSFGHLVLLRHGQTLWSESGQYTGRTNIPLTAVGEEQAVQAGQRLREAFPNGFSTVMTSDLRRAMDTARGAGFDSFTPISDLEEWDYGRAEGRTRQELFEAMGKQWDVWSDGPMALSDALSGEHVEVFPDGSEIVVINGEGERLEDAAARTRRAIDAVMDQLEAGQDVLFVAHAHILRILTTQWVDVNPVFGRKLKLDTAHFCVLGKHHQDHVIERWNA